MTDCSICANTFNHSTRAKIACFSCDFNACKSCIRTFLTQSTAMPKCMNCNARFTTHFLIRHLNRSWVLNTYKDTMTQILTGIEIGKLPETQPYVEAEQERLRLVKLNKTYGKEIDELKRKMKKLSDAVYANQLRMRGETVPGYLMNEFVDGNSVVLDVRKKFIMSCPMDDCRGFLSTQYKCGTCQKTMCSECLTLKETDQHVCEESNRLTAEMIKNETKPCPKCGIRIYKIDGCDQMYCTAQTDGVHCNTAFSWKSGKIETGTIHNPHYYELARNGMNLRNVGDVQCGGMPDIGWVLRTLRALGQPELRGRLARIHAKLCEHVQYTANTCRDRIQAHERRMRSLRVEYMIGKMSKAAFSEIIYKAEREHQRNVDTYHILDLISISGIEAFMSIVRDFPRLSEMEWNDYLCHTSIDSVLQVMQSHLGQLHSVREYCNEQLKQVSITYHCTVHEYDEMFVYVANKYNMNGDKKKV